MRRKKKSGPRDRNPLGISFNKTSNTMNLVKRNRFDRANVDASAATAARIGVNNGHAVLHRNRIQGARLDARFTTGALFSVDYCCHESPR
jgi:hypothetical protein